MIEFTANFTDSNGIHYDAAPFTLEYVVHGSLKNIPLYTGEFIQANLIRYKAKYWASMQQSKTYSDALTLKHSNGIQVFMFMDDPKTREEAADYGLELRDKVLEHLKTQVLPSIDPNVVILQ